MLGERSPWLGVAIAVALLCIETVGLRCYLDARPAPQPVLDDQLIELDRAGQPTP